MILFSPLGDASNAVGLVYFYTGAVIVRAGSYVLNDFFFYNFTKCKGAGNLPEPKLRVSQRTSRRIEKMLRK